MKPLNIFFFSFMLAAGWNASAFADIQDNEVMDMHSILPEKAGAWRAGGEDRIYTRETIFDYMNGAGEIYLSYDFERLFVREYTNPSGPPVVVEVYRMKSPEDAYGVFTHDTEGEDVGVGEGGIYSGGVLMFRKGPFFIRMLAERETPEAKAAIMRMAKHAAEAIARPGRVPPLVSCLPPEGLREREIRYFHKSLSLSIHYYLAAVNILNLGEKTDAALARYDREKQKPRLLVVAYPTPGGAGRAFEQFVRIYLREPAAGSDQHISQIERGEFVSIHNFKRFLIIVFEASTEGMCESLTAQTLGRLREVFK